MMHSLLSSLRSPLSVYLHHRWRVFRISSPMSSCLARLLFFLQHLLLYVHQPQLPCLSDEIVCGRLF